jgi:8-oxo-dGTP pyrophosphatase MutT (NUDIX family)
MTKEVVTMRTLSEDALTLARQLARDLGAGDELTIERWRELETAQRDLARALEVESGPAGTREPLVLVRDRADAPPLVGPRWWFHLLGLRHGASHVVLTTPQGWLLAQRRSRSKDDAPGRLDLAAAGHVGLSDPFEAAWRELGEELGLGRARAGAVPDLRDDALTFLFTYDAEDMQRAGENPPFINRERRWVYHAVLTPRGLAGMRFADGEVSSIMLVGADDLAHLVHRCAAGAAQVPGELDLAPGIMGTLPLWARCG